MKKTLFAVMLAMGAMVMVSCGNKVDKALDKWESAVKELKENKDADKKEELEKNLEEAAKALEELKDEMTDEQKERLEKIATDALGIK